ncbi:MAG: ABC transporter permease, partial [Myxococcales bacterium]|nr:ABC transporter permease [Myxococcales bacterium]
MTDHRSPLAELTLARLRSFFREPSTVFWAFGFPILLSIALGVAFRTRPPEAAAVAVVAGPEAERTVAALRSSPLLKPRVEDRAAADRLLRAGKVALLVLPGEPRTYRYDDTRQDARAARLLVDDVLQRAEGRADVTRVADERVTEPGARYIDFLIPGLVGLNLMSSGMWGIGYAIVEMRTKKLVKRMLATPMRRSDFLLSFILMRGVFVVIEAPVLFGFGWLAFGVRVSGSIPLLLGACLLGAATFGGLGLLVASRAENTQTAGGLMNLVMMPMFICSGVFFSTANFPDAMQPALRALPLTALNDALRVIVNDGAGPAAVAA